MLMLNEVIVNAECNQRMVNANCTNSEWSKLFATNPLTTNH